jgi:hypothetical protein
MLPVRPSPLDILLRPIHHWIWRDAQRRARKLFHFAQTEADGGRDLCRAAELTSDALLRRLYLRHALDEQRHAELFERRGRGILTETGGSAQDGSVELNWLAPGERGLDSLRVESEGEENLLAFLHVSEKAAAGRFLIYQQVLRRDPQTREVFQRVLRDEAFHMSYTHQQLIRIAPHRHGWRLWAARLKRLGKGYLRVATMLAGVLATLLLLLQYFLLLPVFALLAKRAARREPAGWFERGTPTSLKSQYR